MATLGQFNGYDTIKGLLVVPSDGTDWLLRSECKVTEDFSLVPIGQAALYKTERGIEADILFRDPFVFQRHTPGYAYQSLEETCDADTGKTQIVRGKIFGISLLSIPPIDECARTIGEQLNEPAHVRQTNV